MNKDDKRRSLNAILIGEPIIPQSDCTFEKEKLINKDQGIKTWEVSYPSRPIPRLRTTLDGELNRTYYTESLHALLLEPTKPILGTGIIAAHQHHCEYLLGGDEPSGLSGNPNMHYGLELAQRGHTVLAPDALPFGTRFNNERFNGRERGEEQFAHQRSVINGGTLMGRHVLDYMRAVDILQKITGEKIGMIGHSLGGITTLFTTASDPRIKAGVVNCGFGSYDSIDANEYLHNLAVTQNGNFRREFVDLFGLLGILDQQALLISAGTKDPEFPIEDVHKMIKIAKTKYNCSVTLHVFDGNHDFPHKTRLCAYDFLEANLK